MDSPSQHSSTLAISPLVNRTIDTLRSTPNQPLFPSPLAGHGTPLGGNRKTASTIHSSAVLPHSVTSPASPSSTSSSTSPSSPSNLSAAEKLRLWRHDAFMQHHYKTAEYIGDKVLSLTGDPNDAFWLAQVHYNNGNYYRARQLLAKNNLDTTSVSCRYLTGLCLMKLESWDEALDIVGETNPFKNEAQHVKNLDGGIKLESSLCFIRGQIYTKQNNLERAKICYKEAILVDVKCYEAFDELIRNNMLTPVEEWELLPSLDFSDLDENAELVKLLYTSRLNKYLNRDLTDDAEVILREHYNLNDNVDVILSRAELLFMQCKFHKCLELCELVLEKDDLNFAALPTYLASLHEIGAKNKLFLISHKLAEHHPKRPITWLAVGTYYLSINNITEARKYFSKASMLNPNFGQAWIGFAHTFAAEGEHEQAISAYSTASRFFPGTHLPNLFLGMQYLQMANFTLAEEYLQSSMTICSVDPLLLNELGVIYYHNSELSNAEAYFLQALKAAKSLESDSKAWLSVHCNLGHVYRRMNLYGKALVCFEKVLKISNNDANVYSAIGLVYLKVGDIGKSIENLHYALAINSQDAVAADLLRRALEENTSNLDHLGNTGSNNFFARTKGQLQSGAPTLTYRSRKVNSTNASKTPLTNKNKNVAMGNTLNSSVDQIAKDLIEGEDSSDEDEEIMEIESD